MLAQRLPSILPPLAPRELLEVSMVHSVAGHLSGGKLSSQPPFRAPHHSASRAAMVGGGIRARPGEVSLAHMGVLFLDELPEFSPPVLDALREPLETARAVIARANYRVTYPAQFQLIAAMNPCRCGHYGEPGHVCRRGERCALEYQARLSGPFLDRIDLRIELGAVTAADLLLPAPAEDSAIVAARIRAAREVQVKRFARLEVPARSNGVCGPQLVEEISGADGEAMKLLREAAEAMRLTARGYHRVLKVARTIADLAGAPAVRRPHIAEALSYRLPGPQLALAA
jgi:magnesium chelatase family protein